MSVILGSLLVALVAVTAGAQPIEGWTEAKAPLCDRHVQTEPDGSLTVQIHACDPDNIGNVSHLLRSGTEGAASVEVEFAFAGWVQPANAWSRTSSNGHGFCQPWAKQPPTHATDETVCISLYDDGDGNALRLCIGKPDPIRTWYPRLDTATDFAVMAITQDVRLPGRPTYRQLLNIQQVPAIPFGARVRAKLWVLPDWRTYAEVSVDGVPQPRLGTWLWTDVRWRERVGLAFTTTPLSSCTNGVWMRFTTYSVEAR